MSLLLSGEFFLKSCLILQVKYINSCYFAIHGFMASLMTAAILVTGQQSHVLHPLILPDGSFLGHVELLKYFRDAENPSEIFSDKIPTLKYCFLNPILSFNVFPNH